MAQQVQRGYEVTPLDQFAQWATTEGIFCYFEARLLGKQAQVHQDLLERKHMDINKWYYCKKQHRDDNPA